MANDPENNSAEDEVLIRLYLEGDARWFDILYGRYKRQIYSYLNRMLPGQPSTADDIFQQTWVRILRMLPRYESKQRFLAWALRIAHNLVIDHFRRAGRVDDSEPVEEKMDLADCYDAEPWRELDKAELAAALSEAVGKLTGEIREVFLLRREGIGFKEIAEIQKCSVNTALGRMQYALKKVQRHLSEWRDGGR
jgi:RNA polymerase sigma-70 factor (ECF subfamily)